MFTSRQLYKEKERRGTIVYTGKKGKVLYKGTGSVHLKKGPEYICTG